MPATHENLAPLKSAVRCTALLLAVSTAASAYQEVAVQSGGTIRGRISFSGRPPAPRPAPVTKDAAVCGKMRDSDAFLLSKDGGVANVVVYLLQVPAGKPWKDDGQPVLDQQGCHYLPHVQIVREHATLLVRSSDPILHNVHSFLNGASVINLAMPARKGVAIKQRLDKPGGMQLKCDVHAFMRGGIFVATNPYAALTGPDGSYTIEDVPPGQYTIASWHEEAGPISDVITVPPSGAVEWNGRVR